jgi:hypothetical protein
VSAGYWQAETYEHPRNVIVYHGLGDCRAERDQYCLFMANEKFAQQMEFLARHRRVVPLDDIISGLRNNAERFGWANRRPFASLPHATGCQRSYVSQPRKACVSGSPVSGVGAVEHTAPSDLEPKPTPRNGTPVRRGRRTPP